MVGLGICLDFMLTNNYLTLGLSLHFLKHSRPGVARYVFVGIDRGPRVLPARFSLPNDLGR